jgi:hypothetical protein
MGSVKSADKRTGNIGKAIDFAGIQCFSVVVRKTDKLVI